MLTDLFHFAFEKDDIITTFSGLRQLPANAAKMARAVANWKHPVPRARDFPTLLKDVCRGSSPSAQLDIPRT
jgi:hypothetical protein